MNTLKLKKKSSTLEESRFQKIVAFVAGCAKMARCAVERYDLLRAPLYSSFSSPGVWSRYSSFSLRTWSRCGLARISMNCTVNFINTETHV